MLRFRGITGFFTRLSVIYILFVLPWPGLKAEYAAFFRTGGNLVLPSLIPEGSIRLAPAPDPTDRFDTYIHFANKRTGGEGEAVASSRNSGYLQTAFLISLILATPQAWSGRLWALLWGLILVNLA
ncbi:MAG: hypothetical protein ACYTFA_14580, partial [Planctomycetota bacterium]